MTTRSIFHSLVSHWLCLLMAGIFVASGPLRAEGSGTHAADKKNPMDSVAWFSTSTRTVIACVERANDFPYDEEQLKSKVETAFATWTNYMARKEQCGALKKGDAFAPKIEVHSPCKGGEHLRLYFGVSPKEVKDHLEENKNALAFAQKTKVFVEDFWSEGFIWFSPAGDHKIAEAAEKVRFDWRDEYVFDAMLLHEMGHVFGVDHVNGTVMRGDFADKLLWYVWFYGTIRRQSIFEQDRLLNQIDQVHELLICPSNYRGNVSAAVFESLVGEAPEGQAEAMIRHGAKGDQFILRDGKGEREPFTLEVPWDQPHLGLRGFGQGAVFQQYGLTYDLSFTKREEHFTGYHHHQTVDDGYLVAPGGKKLLISLERNVSFFAPLIMRIVTGNRFSKIEMRPDK